MLLLLDLERAVGVGCAAAELLSAPGMLAQMCACACWGASACCCGSAAVRLEACCSQLRTLGYPILAAMVCVVQGVEAHGPAFGSNVWLFAWECGSV
jgi:hypothetical protein